ncbi:hypothetical protein H4R24_005313, partial [Coemansia sp. RSA 988]
NMLQEAGRRQQTPAESPQELMGHADAGQAYPMDASHTTYIGGAAAYHPVTFEDHSAYASPSAGQPLPPRLHAIDEASEETEYDADGGRQGKVRRNLMSGIRRVAKAVRTAAVLKNEGGRRQSISGGVQQNGYTRGVLGAERITHPHMAVPAQEAERQYALYPGAGHSPRSTGARSAMSVATSGQRISVQPGPRQRSLTQQSRAAPAMNRTQSQQQRVRSHHGGLTRVHTSASLASMGQLSSGSSTRSSPVDSINEMLAMDGPVRRDLSPLETQLPAMGNLNVTRVSGGGGPPAARMYSSWEVDVGAAVSAPHSARSAEAFPTAARGLTQAITPPRRDRSMTVPSSDQRAAGRIELRIPHSPLMKPTTQASVGRSAGTRIQRQAVRNLSGEPLTKVMDDMLAMQQLPSPADTTAGNALASMDSSLEALERTPLSRMLAGSMATDAVAPGGLSEVALEAHHASAAMHSGGLSHYLKLSADTSECSSPAQASVAFNRVNLAQSLDGDVRAATRARGVELRSIHDSGVQVHRHAAGSVSTSESELVRVLPRDSASVHGPSAYASQQSLHGPSAFASQQSLPLGRDVRAALPPSHFSFGHSRYSLINADGSLNLINFQFDQLDGYQKRLSATGSNVASPPHSSEAGLGGRLLRKNADGGWFWGGAEDGFAADAGGRQRRLTRKPRKQTPLSPPRARTETVLPAGLLQLQPLSVNLWTPNSDARRRPRASASITSSHTRSPSASTTHSSAIAAPRASEGSVGAWSSASRRPSQQMSVYPLSDARPGSVATRWPRLMQMAPESVPFDAIYQCSAAAMTLDQALTLVEGSSLRSPPSSNSQLASKLHHRRLHKRSASALTGNELDDIMIRTAEICHSVQTAIRVQHANDSGLRGWIESVLGSQRQQEQEQPLCAPAPLLSQSSSFESPVEDRLLISDVSVTAACPLSPGDPASPVDDRPEFFSADCSPNGARHSDEAHFSAQQHVPEFRINGSRNSSELAGQSRSSLEQWSFQSPRRPARILSGAMSGAVAAVSSLGVDRQSDSQESLSMHNPVVVVPASSPRP